MSGEKQIEVKALELEISHPGDRSFLCSSKRFEEVAATPLIYWWSDDMWATVAAFKRLGDICVSSGEAA